MEDSEERRRSLHKRPSGEWNDNPRPPSRPRTATGERPSSASSGSFPDDQLSMRGSLIVDFPDQYVNEVDVGSIREGMETLVLGPDEHAVSGEMYGEYRARAERLHVVRDRRNALKQALIKDQALSIWADKIIDEQRRMLDLNKPLVLFCKDRLNPNPKRVAEITEEEIRVFEQQLLDEKFNDKENHILDDLRSAPMREQYREFTKGYKKTAKNNTPLKTLKYQMSQVRIKLLQWRYRLEKDGDVEDKFVPDWAKSSGVTELYQNMEIFKYRLNIVLMRLAVPREIRNLTEVHLQKTNLAVMIPRILAELHMKKCDFLNPNYKGWMDELKEDDLLIEGQKGEEAVEKDVKGREADNDEATDVGNEKTETANTESS